jgi:hypothetical protein
MFVGSRARLREFATGGARLLLPRGSRCFMASMANAAIRAARFWYRWYSPAA